jgi:ubiquinone/menaquinone biosynthesis C-methylase UbiE
MKNGKQRENADFDEWAPTYESSRVQRLFFDPIHRRMIKLILNCTIEERPKILDVGCGTGRLLRYVSNVWTDSRLTGVDVSEAMIKVASEFAPEHDFYVSPAEKLPLQDNAFDIVLSSLTLHHWNDANQGVKEIARVLRPGGLFCLADHLGPKWAVRFFGPGAKTNRELENLYRTNALEIIAKSRFFGWVGIRLARKG